MPISRGYSLDAYCDCEQCTKQEDEAGNYIRAEMASAAGETYAECAAELRYHGWYLSRDKSIACAPGHKIPKRKQINNDAV